MRISKKFPGDADVTDLETTLWEQRDRPHETEVYHTTFIYILNFTVMLAFYVIIET